MAVTPFWTLIFWLLVCIKSCAYVKKGNRAVEGLD